MNGLVPAFQAIYIYTDEKGELTDVRLVNIGARHIQKAYENAPEELKKLYGIDSDDFKRAQLVAVVKFKERSELYRPGGFKD